VRLGRFGLQFAVSFETESEFQVSIETKFKQLEPTGRYTLSMARYEAWQATQDGTRAMIHICRISEMLNAGYTDEQVRASPRVNGLLQPSPLCSEPWAMQYAQDDYDFMRAMNGQVPANPRAIDRACRIARIILTGQPQEVAALLGVITINISCSGAELLDTQRRVIERTYAPR
jgi:hypothetical protein